MYKPISIGLALTIILTMNNIAFSASWENQKAKKTVDQIIQLNQNTMDVCENDSLLPSATPIPPAKSLFSDAYFKRTEKDGVSKDIDWLWINALGKMDPMMPKEGDSFYQMEIDLLKKSKSKKQMLMMRFGKCWLNMNGTYGLNEAQDKIILTETNSYDLSFPDHCTFGTEGCIKINGRTHRVIAKNKVDSPLTKETMNTDYLKPIRDAKQLIDEKCR